MLPLLTSISLDSLNDAHLSVEVSFSCFSSAVLLPMKIYRVNTYVYCEVKFLLLAGQVVFSATNHS